MKKTYVIQPDTPHEREVTVELLEPTTGGRRFRLTLTSPEEDVEDRTVEVDAASYREGVYSLLIEGRSHEVSVGRRKEQLLSQVGGHVFALDVLDEQAMRRRQMAGGQAIAGGPELEAPMSGKVIQVSAEVGDVVEEGQTVLIIEAMKMENDIKAHRPGAITSLKVAAGDTVDVGQALLTIAVAEEA